MIRTLLTTLPAGHVLALYRDGDDAVLLSDPAALAPLSMEQRFELYNQMFADLDDGPTVQAIATVLDLDAERLRRAV